MRHIFLTLTLVISLSLNSFAQISPSDSDFRSIELSRFASEPQLKNPNTAMWISVGSTIGSYLAIAILSSTPNPNQPALQLFSLTLLAAPALGYLYTNNWNDFWNSVSRRFVGRLVMATGAVVFVLGAFDALLDDDEWNSAATITGLGLMLVGGIYNIRITFNDFRQVRTRVDEYNESLIQSVQVMPAVDPVNKAVGLGFRVNF